VFKYLLVNNCLADTYVYNQPQESPTDKGQGRNDKHAYFLKSNLFIICNRNLFY